MQDRYEVKVEGKGKETQHAIYDNAQAKVVYRGADENKVSILCDLMNSGRDNNGS